ncbi:MAG: hypothetical protein KF819_31575 [Labilithrix sp.]|nr:hypothetical protein [Labilithrix sp.]
MRAIAFVAALSLFALAGCGERHQRRASYPAQARLSIDELADQRAREASSRRGGARVGDVMHGETLRRREAQDLSVELDTAHCYWFSGATDDMGHRIALRVVDPRGLTVAHERAKWSDALVEYCPAIDGVYRVEAKLHHHGPYALAIYAGARSSMSPVMVTSAPLRIGASPVDLIAREAAIAAPGARPVGAPFAGSKTETYWAAALGPDKCYWLVAAGQSGVTGISIDVWDPTDQRVAGIASSVNVASVRHCVAAGGMYKLRAKIAGGGEYALGVYEQ